jgi:hypothetical protein
MEGSNGMVGGLKTFPPSPHAVSAAASRSQQAPHWKNDHITSLWE